MLREDSGVAEGEYLASGVSNTVRTYVETCVGCQVADPRTSQEPLKLTVLPERPWQYVHADFKGRIGKK